MAENSYVSHICHTYSIDLVNFTVTLYSLLAVSEIEVAMPSHTLVRIIIIININTHYSYNLSIMYYIGKYSISSYGG